MNTEGKEKEPRRWHEDEAWICIVKYCTYQERSIKAVLDKLRMHGINGVKSQDLLVRLESGDYLNVQRYAETYVRSKSKYNKWGIKKIENMLKTQMIPKSVIDKAVKSLDKDDYSNVLYKEIEKYIANVQRRLKSANSFEIMNKTFNYFYSKGYSKELIKQVYEEVISQM